MPPFSSDNGDDTTLSMRVGGTPPDSPSRSSFRVLSNGGDTAPSSPSSSKYPTISPLSEERRVKFNPKLEVHEIPDIDDYSDEEAFASWYSYEELQHISLDVNELVRQINRQGTNSSSGSPLGVGPSVSSLLRKDVGVECVRGIEERVPERSMQIHHVRINALYAVMSEQYNQQQQFQQKVAYKLKTQPPNQKKKYRLYYDAERIRSVYSAVSVHSIRGAYDTAANDAYEAQCYQQEGKQQKQKQRNNAAAYHTDSIFNSTSSFDEIPPCFGLSIPNELIKTLFNPSKWGLLTRIE